MIRFKTFFLALLQSQYVKVGWTLMATCDTTIYHFCFFCLGWNASKVAFCMCPLTKQKQKLKLKLNWFFWHQGRQVTFMKRESPTKS